MRGQRPAQHACHGQWQDRLRAIECHSIVAGSVPASPVVIGAALQTCRAAGLRLKLAAKQKQEQPLFLAETRLSVIHTVTAAQHLPCC